MSTQRKRLLVVDDEREMADFVANVARRIGFDAAAAETASDFAREYTSGVDIIVLDLFMPEMDGIEIIRFLAENKSRAKLILMSGVDRSILTSAEKLAAESGLDVIAALGKPFRKSELQEALTNHTMATPRYEHKTRGGLDAAALEEAIAEKDFRLVFQPQVRLHDRSWCGVEALLRWQHSLHGPISPDYFIPLAEEFGLIDRITEYVFDEALSQCRRWADLGHFPEMSVNVSARTLQDLELPEKLERRVAEYGLHAHQITIEITETSVAHDLRTSLDILTRLRIKGFVLSIDDFGTGYSSMLQLVEAPFTELKVDRAFVGSMALDSNLRSVVSASIKLAHEIGMTAVAEGVEDEATWQALADLGCDTAQGYWIAKPMEGANILDWWEDWSAPSGNHQEATNEPPLASLAAG
jgi:EAL domain-containing protein (putative c-di-GMP-specific phosphodiesterase class I)/CheY-like chemotaxis protein